MYFLDIIVGIIFALIIARQGNRINRIEKILSEKNTVPVKPAQTDTVLKQNVVGAVPQATVVPDVPVPQAPQAPEQVFHEEVSSGRILGGIGIAAVFIGVSFFLKYAFDNNWVGPLGRIMLGVLGGFVLMGVGQSLRKKYLEYSDLLMGGGLALLYLSIFSAHFFFNLIDPFTAWFFMALVTALGLVISIVNATMILAFVSLLGGLVTPFLANSGGNDMLALFGYLTILNIGALSISSFKKWPELDVTVFLGTAINFIFWYSRFYSADVLAPALSFCFLTFLIFLVSSISRSVVKKELATQGDFVVIGGNAIFLAFVGYSILNPDHHSFLAPAFIFVAAIYFVVALLVNKANRGDTALNIFLPGLAVTFLSVSVPLYFSSNEWIAVAWLVESVALYILAVRVGNRGFQVMGAILYVLGCLSFFTSSAAWSGGQNFSPIFNEGFGVSALAAIAGFMIAYIYKRYGSVSNETQARGLSAFTIVGNIFAIYAISTQIIFFFAAVGTDSARNYSNTMVSIFWAIYAALLTAIGFTKRLANIRMLGLVLFIITAMKVFIDVWSLGQVYRIVSFIVFGVIALAASFVYAKYKDRLKEVI